MHGFFGSYGQKVSYELTSFDSRYIADTLSADSLHVERRTLPKFLQDKPWHQDEQYAYSIEGIIFAPTTDLGSLYEQYGETFMQQLRGSFSGFFYDKRQDLLLVFNDHIGEKMLFYYTDELGVAFASDWHLMAQALSSRTSLPINQSFCWSLLTYGYSPIQETPTTAIHRIGAGEYLRIQGGKQEKKIYHRFTNDTISRSKEQNLSELDRLFRQAVQRVLDKNEHYHLQNLAALSAGLDSRMSVCVAHSLTKQPIHCFTYSQSCYYDETIPRQITQAWQQSLHFVPLDGGEYLQNIDLATTATQGLVNYSGAVQVQYGTQDIISEQTGVILTGMIGDIIVNSQHRNYRSVYFGEGAISTRYLTSLSHTITHNIEYTDQEIYYLYVRGFNCANLGSPAVFQTTGESYSPFYDVDLLEFMYSIPRSDRYAYRLYDQWIQRYYPQAAQWKHNGMRTIGHHPIQLTLLGRTIPINQLPKRAFWFVCKKLKIHDFYRQNLGESMNPEDYWLESNSLLSGSLQAYFDEHIDLLNDYPDIKQAAKNLYETGTAMEKFNVLSLLAGLSLC